MCAMWDFEGGKVSIDATVSNTFVMTWKYILTQPDLYDGRGDNITVLSDRVVLAESKDCTQFAIHGTVQSTGIGPEAIIGPELWVKATESKSRRS